VARLAGMVELTVGVGLGAVQALADTNVMASTMMIDIAN